jgi:hypothetical protein
VTIDGNPGMIRKEIGLLGRIRRETDKQIPKFAWNSTPSSTNSHYVEKLSSLNML